jgi:hypothetical protein
LLAAQDAVDSLDLIDLKEVVIRPGRIRARKDTLRYDLTEFKTEQDRYIRDVLGRLPGIEVEENGTVRYNGRAVDHYLVEGMDITGGRYNQINNNLRAEAISSVDIMENYQSKRALQHKQSSDEVALNLRLDPAARDQWMVGIGAGAGSALPPTPVADQALRTYFLNALQLGHRRQHLYTAKGNNTGDDLAGEQLQLTALSAAPPPLSSRLTHPFMSAPLDDGRVRFNDSHTLHLSRMTRGNDSQTLRLQASYTHDQTTQRRTNQQLYFLPEDTLLLSESYHLRQRSDVASLELHYEENRPTHYLTGRLTLEGKWQQSDARELSQSIRTTALQVTNRFNRVTSRRAATWELSTVMRYALLPATLRLAEGSERLGQQSFYADTQLARLHRRGVWSQRYTLGLQGEWVHPGALWQTSLYATAHYTLERGKWRTTLTLPVRLRYDDATHDRPMGFFTPSLSLRYQLNYHWRLSLHATRNRSLAELTELTPQAYRRDYRTWMLPDEVRPLYTTQSIYLHAQYKHTAQEFFATATLSHVRRQSNSLMGQSIRTDTLLYQLKGVRNRTQTDALSIELSKGFYRLRLKASFSLRGSRSTGTRLSLTSGQLQRYELRQFTLEPRIHYTAFHTLQIAYHLILSGSSTRLEYRLPLLFDTTQRLSLTLPIQPLELKLQGEHYRNDLGNDRHLNTFLVDASLTYRHRRWQYEASLTNLLNQSQYGYTLYTDTRHTTSQLSIRPRELIGKITYRL